MARSIIEAGRYALRNPGEAFAVATILLSGMVLTGWGTLWDVVTP